MVIFGSNKLKLKYNEMMNDSENLHIYLLKFTKFKNPHTNQFKK